MTPRTDCTWEEEENIWGRVGGEGQNTPQKIYKGTWEKILERETEEERDGKNKGEQFMQSYMLQAAHNS